MSISFGNFLCTCGFIGVRRSGLRLAQVLQERPKTGFNGGFGCVDVNETFGVRFVVFGLFFLPSAGFRSVYADLCQFRSRLEFLAPMCASNASMSKCTSYSQISPRMAKRSGVLRWPFCSRYASNSSRISSVSSGALMGAVELGKEVKPG